MSESQKALYFSMIGYIMCNNPVDMEELEALKEVIFDTARLAVGAYAERMKEDDERTKPKDIDKI